MKAFGWSLREIDETNAESLIPFIRRFNLQESGSDKQEKRVYCDQVSWLG